MKSLRKQNIFVKILVVCGSLVLVNLFFYGLWKLPTGEFLLFVIAGVGVVIAIAWRRLYIRTKQGKFRRRINFGGIWMYKLLKAVGALGFVAVVAGTIIFLFQYSLEKYLFWVILTEIVAGCMIAVAVKKKFRIIEWGN